jgi:hypothetical protein
MGAFENSVEQSKSQLNNFTNRRDEIVGDNKKLLSSAKALQSSDLIQGVISNMSGVAGIQGLKSVGGKGLKWVDKKLGGKIARDTKGFKNMVKKKGEKFLKKGVKQVADKVKGVGDEGKEVELQDVSPESQTETTAVEDVGEQAEQVEDKVGLDEIGGQGFKERVSDGYTGPATEQKEGDGDAFEKGAEDDVSAENKFENATKEVNAENDKINKTNETDGADEDDADVNPEADVEDGADDVAKKLAEKASATAVDEGVGNTLEGLGAGADATGIGALVGVPLEIAGGIADIVGAVEAGKSFGDWFNEDVLGNKPPVKAQQIKLPNAPSTLASQGFQATPSYSSAVEVGGGAGGW